MRDGEVITGGDINPRLIETYQTTKDRSYLCVIRNVEFVTPDWEVAEMLKKECEEFFFPGSDIQIESIIL